MPASVYLIDFSPCSVTPDALSPASYTFGQWWNEKETFPCARLNCIPTTCTSCSRGTQHQSSITWLSTFQGKCSWGLHTPLLHGDGSSTGVVCDKDGWTVRASANEIYSVFFLEAHNLAKLGQFFGVWQKSYPLQWRPFQAKFLISAPQKL